MIDQLKSNLEELKLKKLELQPKIDEINIKRKEEIQNINKKYDHMIYEVNYELERFGNEIYNEMIKSFIDIVNREFDLKRSTSLYTVSDDLKNYKKIMAQFEIFPEELINRLHNVINGDPVENIIYDLDIIKEKFLKR